MFSVVKMMKEQGNQFDWSQIAIDIPSLPCFDQDKMAEFEKVVENGGEATATTELGALLSEGYSVVSYTYSGNTTGFHFVVKVTGDSPSVEIGEDDSLVFNDCEPVTVDAPTATTPIRVLTGTYGSFEVYVHGFAEAFGLVRATGNRQVIMYAEDNTCYLGVYWEEQIG